MKPVEVLNWEAFMKGSIVVENLFEIKRYERKQQIYKTVIRVGAVATITLFTTIPLPPALAHAATTLAEAQVKEEGNTWDRLVQGLVNLLDPIAKVFGVIAGIAIMTGNGKIGLERLFWLSVGYLTARKVDDWINFLNKL